MTSGRHRVAGWKAPVVAVGAAVGFGLGLLLSSAMVRATHGMPVIWLPSCFLAAALMLLPSRWGAVCTVLCLSAASLIFLIEGGIGPQFLFLPIYVVEAVAVAWLARRQLRGVWVTSLPRVMRLLFCAVAPCAIASSIGGVLLSAVLPWSWPTQPWPMMVLQVFASDMLGLSIMLTSILVLGAPTRRYMARRPLFEVLAAVGMLVLLAVHPVMLWGYPATLLLFPAVIAFAFRYGPKPTVAASLVVIGLTVPLTVFGAAPRTGKPMSGQDLVMLQEFALALFFMGLATSVAVARQQHLRALLLRRTGAARAARARALQASRAKTDFLATMSHEIRTPLNSILGFTQVMLRREDLPTDMRRQLALVDSAGDALLTVVNDILDFSKVEAGQVSLSPRPIDMRAVAEDCRAIVAEAAERKGLALTLLQDAPEAAHHRLYDQRLRQVLLNLLNNAIKFTESGEVRLCLTITQGEAVDRVRAEVTDTGIGVPADRVDRLFQRFSQVDGSVTRTYGGTGLGLAICKHLIELMGGSIGVESESGRGSTFWFEIPAERCAAPEAATVTAASDEALTMRVLLVDDHPMNRELGATLLQVLGCDVEVAEDGLQALEMVKAGAYDAVLMDLHMPRMDGFAAARAIRALGGAAAATPLIAMSADVMPEQTSQLTDLGFVDSVPKPVRIDVLHAALTRWTAHGTAASEQAA